MKNLSIIVLMAIALVASLFSCQKDKKAKVDVNTYENSVITEINLDSLQGNLIPVHLDWNERVLASFIADDHTCELLVGYITPKYGIIANFAHRKIIVFGKSGHWDRKRQSAFNFDDGKRASLVSSYPANTVSPLPKKPVHDEPLKTAKELPVITK